MMNAESKESSAFTSRADDLRLRTKKYALRIVRFYTCLPKTTEAQILGKQVIRSGTSVGAHYHEGMRARSNAEFVSKLEGGLQELQETLYWLELLQEAGISTGNNLKDCLAETDELIRIFVASVRTAKKSR